MSSLQWVSWKGWLAVRCAPSRRGNSIAPLPASHRLLLDSHTLSPCSQLTVFAVQNGFAVLIMRWSKVYAAEPYSSQVAVLMQELVVKLPISAAFYILECKGVLSAARFVSEGGRLFLPPEPSAFAMAMVATPAVRLSVCQLLTPPPL